MNGFPHRKRTALVQLLALVLTGGLTASSQASDDYDMTDFETMPITIVEEGVTPQVMLATSNDQQLYYAAYNDYSDINNDGIADITYDHSIDYYGYFDSYKCYTYSTSKNRFVPDEITEDKYCNSSSSDQWSGNFLNWVSMTRIDTIRKILFGGHRRIDTSSQTVLERAYLPTDIHSFAKYYAGTDLPQLTPFTRSDYTCDEGNLDAKSGCNGDEQKMGITFGNTTDVNTDNYNSSTYSQAYTDPPLIKVVKGNYSLWASGERRQIGWSAGAPNGTDISDDYSDGGSGSGLNANVPANSGIYAYSNSPNWSERLGEGNYVAKVEVCVDGLIGEENCKLYPGPDAVSGTSDDNYKPIGLLQTYGDDGEMQFGMVAGSYHKHASGGVLIQNVGSMADEINVDTDGTFSQVAAFAGGPADKDTASGIINAWSLYRITGYYAPDGTYSGDSCTSYTDASVSYQTDDNQCQNWVNPFSEIYYQALNYFAGNGVLEAYEADDDSEISGLNKTSESEVSDPLDDDNYCADLFIINLNTSNPSYDYDELDLDDYQPANIWDSEDLPAGATSSAMTDYVGVEEGISGNSYFIGETSVGSGTEDQLCTAKTITSFGKAGGVCPEAPRNGGSYRIAGLAYYAHTKDIRPDDNTERGLEGDQTINTFSVAMSSGAPVMEIPNPSDTAGDPLVTLLPACRDQSATPNSSCTLMSFKVVEQEVDTSSMTASGKYYLAYERTEMGSDYDQDMWGTLSYELDLSKNTISITTQVFAQSSSGHLGFGYVINGTTKDGFHAHSGINGFSYKENIKLDEGNNCADSDGCNCRSDTTQGACNISDAEASTITFKLGSSDATLLEDPLWYAAKYGGFDDENGNDLPDETSEWDAEINSTGNKGSDGIPDNFFYATNPEELESSLTRVLNAILNRTSSGTAVSIVSANVDGDGAVYQAYYEPSRKSASDNTVSATWFGTLNALWLDSDGYTRQDCTAPADNAIDENGQCIELTECIPDGVLDNYCVDQVVETYYDDSDGVTRAYVYQTGDPDEFATYSMQGMVVSASSSSVTMVPYFMQGLASYTSPSLTISPYVLTGTVSAYDETSGAVTLTIKAGGWNGGAGKSLSNWAVTNGSVGATGSTEDSIKIKAGTVSFTVSPAGSWIAEDDTLTLTSKNLVGNAGDVIEDWVVTCLAGDNGIGTVDSGSVKLTNTKDTITSITVSSGSFDSCTQASLTTYDMTGTEGDSYSSWEVSDLDDSTVSGTSTTVISLANSGQISLDVSFDNTWPEEGDRVLLSNYSASKVELYELSYLWDAREQLFFDDLSETELLTNRNYSTEKASAGRYIMTWVDKDLDSVVDTGEYRDFIPEMITESDSVSPTFFNLDDDEDAEELISYIRGVEDDSGESRNRTIQYSSNDEEEVMRLGDIINSTPVSVSSPQEAYDDVYYDTSYKAFRQQYIDRRVMVYVGANDGMLHAFNGGFYSEDSDGNISFSTSGTNYNDGDAVEHALGAEMWAYVPMNLLPQLQWLKDPNYADSHVSFMDAPPRVIDAKIFNVDADHPNGWGTILIAGMNLGGGEMDVTVDAYGDGTLTKEVSFRSAYVIMDITNPEVPPTLLGEIQIPDGSFTTVVPAIPSFQDTGSSTSCNGGVACQSWYMIFGSGPDNLTTVESSQTAKVYLFDLGQLTGIASATTGAPDGCTNVAVNDSYNAIQCDTGVANSYMGKPVTVDWNIDFLTDTSYFGLMRDTHSSDGSDTSEEGGMIFRMAFNNEQSPALWSAPELFFNAERPISIGVKPIPSIDESDNHWLFFGSGRYLYFPDRTTVETESLIGVKDLEDGLYPLSEDDLLDVTDVDVYTDGTLVTPLVSNVTQNTLSTFDNIVTETANDLVSGWKMNLEPISGVEGSDPATRNITDSTLVSGILLSTVFQPSNDACEAEGLSRLYGLYYLTGTAYPDPAVMGTTSTTVDGEVKTISNKYVNLGTGSASAPAFHFGSGDDGVFIQMSTGDTAQVSVTTPESIRAQRISWSDQEMGESDEEDDN